MFLKLLTNLSWKKSFQKGSFYLNSGMRAEIEVVLAGVANVGVDYSTSGNVVALSNLWK